MGSYNGRSRQGENMLRTIHFDHPAWTPAQVGFLPACWMKYGESLDDMLLAHPRLFPNHQKPARRDPPVLEGLLAAGRVTDCWGCTWENLHPGIIGQVVGHPLADWSSFDTWTRPDPLKDGLLGPRDWDSAARYIREKKERGDFNPDWILPHGHHYLLLCDLRGFANMMLDMITGEPRLRELVEVITHFNATVARQYLDLGSEWIGLGEDLGTQHGLPISPELWRQWVKPGYEAVAGQARDRGVPVFLHSDGHILPIVGDLIETGVTVLNPQIRPNTLAGIREQMKGKVAIYLDLDRQFFPFARPEQLKEHVREAHATLYDPAGGLMLSAEIGEDVPLENMDALFSAVEEVCALPDPETTGHCSVCF